MKNESSPVSIFMLMANDVVAFDGKRTRAPEIYQLMMENQCWDLMEQTPHRSKMKPGDTFVFYLGGSKARYIAGEATLAGEIYRISDESPITCDREQIPYFTLRAPLTDIKAYDPQKTDIDTIAKLSFFKNSTVERKYIGLLLRNGVRKLSKKDLQFIRKRVD